MRTCRFCNLTEAESRFYPADSVSGRAAGLVCAPCWVKKSIAWRNANLEKCNNRLHKHGTMKRLGITEEEYDRLHEGSPTCAGCGATKGQSGKRLTVDHCHTTGAVRGLLCHGCNKMIGHVKDRPEILRNLAAYLEASMRKAAA
jgi:hypothetical protein